jgi:hypothetical protein
MSAISDEESRSWDSVEHPIRCALANSENDLAMPILDLCLRRDSQADGYVAAMQSRDSVAALRNLRASGTPFRILLAAQEDVARQRIADELSRIVDDSLLMMLRIIEALIIRCHGKACRATAQHV